MKKIINTTNERISVVILGNPYTLEPKGFLVVPESVADYWTNNLHSFLNTEEVSVVTENDIKNVEEVKVEVTKKKSK